MQSIATMEAGLLQQKLSTQLESFARNRASNLASAGKQTNKITENIAS